MTYSNFETRETERSSVGSYDLIPKKLTNFLKIFLLKQADKHFSSWKVRFRDFYHKKYIFLIKITKYLRILSKNDHDYKLLANDLKFRQQIWVFLHVYLWFAMSGILKDL